MEPQFAIIVADRNRHVRDFLKREFEADGCLILQAKDEKELLSLIDGPAPADLLILDLEVPCFGGADLMEQLNNRKPLMPVVVHTLITEPSALESVNRAAAFLEKRGNNIDHLKDVVFAVLRRYYPDRFPEDEGDATAKTPLVRL
jgi:DNA-binding NtrC family response regulator